MTIHDACASRNDLHTQDAIRQILSSLGYTIEEHPWSKEKTGCCGYGGLVSYVNKEVADDLSKDCLPTEKDTLCVTYCMACKDRLCRAGGHAKHITELIYDTPAESAPDISKKRLNRLSLKEELLKEIWNEDVMKEPLNFTYTLSDEVKKKMDERMILESDLIRVLQHYHETKEAIYDQKQGIYTTTLRIGNVSFWTTFKEENDHYTLLSAYSHRMTVRERG